MISYDEMVRYILILREENMENNYKLSEEQVNLIKKVENALKSNHNLKDKLDKMTNASSMSEMLEIYSGKKQSVKIENLQDNIIYQQEEKVEEKGRQYTLVNNRKSGYIDALVMALVTGFVGGMTTMIIFLMIK